jgi:adenylate kinase
MINLILFGPPGSGKGTQAAKIKTKYNLLHISTGDLFRYELGNNTPLGIEARSYMERGELVPDIVTIKMLKKKVMEHPEVSGFIFDGFPRNINQAGALDSLLESLDQTIDALIALDVSDEEIIARILERGKTSGRADDLDVDIIKKRIEIYTSETQPVFEYYEAKNKAFKVNGLGTIDDIYLRLCSVVEHYR